jgi:hypothetical protein
LIDVVPLDQVLPYSSRRVTVTFAYADNRGEQPNRVKKPSKEAGEMAGNASRFRELSRAALPAAR